MSIYHTRLSAASILLSCAMASAAAAAAIEVTITNEQGADGLFLTPLLSIFHDGNYDTFDVGGSASNGVETIAETGSAMPESDAAMLAGATTGVITSPGGFPGAPVIDPGETASMVFNLDPNSDRFFSYLSMVIPSNDLFIGNEDSMAYEVFDIAGAFTNLGAIQIFTSNIWDAGTEENNNVGAAFNAAGGVETNTNDPIAQQASVFFLSGQGTAAGTTLNLPQDATLLATIELSQVPVPAALPMLLFALGGLGIAARKRKG
ncbi:MAG: spondin domain-containing protein [Boseongicola sp.]